MPGGHDELGRARPARHRRDGEAQAAQLGQRARPCRGRPVGRDAHAPHLPRARYGGQLVDLDLVTTLRSTGAVREFQPGPVGDDVLRRILETARFAPSGGNRQGWRVIVVKDPSVRAALRDIYLTGW